MSEGSEERSNEGKVVSNAERRYNAVASLLVPPHLFKALGTVLKSMEGNRLPLCHGSRRTHCNPLELRLKGLREFLVELCVPPPPLVHCSHGRMETATVHVQDDRHGSWKSDLDDTAESWSWNSTHAVSWRER